MRQFFSILCLCFLQNLLAQNKGIDIEQIQLEANQLYAYRMMEFRGNELIAESEALQAKVADYILYHDKYHLRMVLIDHTYENKVGNFYFDMREEDAQVHFDSVQAPLNMQEQRHYQIYQKMLKSVSKQVKERVEIREGFWINSLLIQQNTGYKLYVFANTNLQNIIPLGNDAVFIGDEQGKVLTSEWFHDGLVQLPISSEGIRLATHKHESNQAYISPTEIASFRFYGMLYGMLQMPILIPDQGLLLGYDSVDNKIFTFYSKKGVQ